MPKKISKNPYTNTDSKSMDSLIWTFLLLCLNFFAHYQFFGFFVLIFINTLTPAIIFRLFLDQRLKISSGSSNSYVQSYNEELELAVDSVLLPGYKIEDIGYVGDTYKIKLEGFITTY